MMQDTLTAHVRRLTADGDPLYIRLDVEDLVRCGLYHGLPITLTLRDRVVVGGVVKTSGSTPWLAPREDGSNEGISKVLREAGFAHGDDVEAYATIDSPA